VAASLSAISAAEAEPVIGNGVTSPGVWFAPVERACAEPVE
jgi:hypothetical protein